MSKSARRRLVMLSLAVLVMLAALVFLLSRNASDQLAPYQKALGNHAKLSGGRVTETITLTEPLNGAAITVTGETLLSAESGMTKMREERIGVMNDKSYYEASYYDGVNYFVSNKTGWLIFGGEYYRKFVGDAPFDTLGPGFDSDEVSGVKTTTDEDGTYLIINLTTSQPAVELSLPMYSGGQVAIFKPEQVDVAINNQRLIAEMTYTGQVSVEFPDRVDHYSATLHYVVTRYNEKFDITQPVMPVPEEWKETLQRISDERAAELAAAESS